MNITFDSSRMDNEVRKSQTSSVCSNADRTTISHVNSKGVFALDISGTVMDNTAYEGQGKTTEDVMQDAGLIDVTTQKNYLAVMSNTMSDEDFARLQEEGYHPGNTDIETVVTIVDEIKAALAKGGKHITGYTDDLDIETLEQITGSSGLAQAIAKEFEAHDIPVTKENVENVLTACGTVTQLQTPSDGVMKYMVRNHMEPTIDNLYKAQYSALADADKQGRGYYQDTAGYYAKKAEDYNWQQLQPQMEKVITQAGLDVSDETLGDARWLIEKGMPLTEDSINALYELRNLELPLTMEEAVGAAAKAIADGRKTGNANIADDKSMIEKALEYAQTADSISDEAVDRVAAEGKILNLRNLKAAQIQISMNYRAEGYTADINGRRMMEEVRLQMTVEANIRLMKSGISVDTVQLQQLVDALKETQKQRDGLLFGDTQSARTGQPDALYRSTLSAVRELPGMPAALVGKFAIYSRIQITMTGAASAGVSSVDGTFTLQAVYEQGAQLRSAYERAGESYETLMTAPRADLGDSIKKAFRNVDDLLDELKLEVSDVNRRAVRILGYNHMEISAENVEAVKTADLSIKRVLGKLTPAAVMELIRDGVNPMNMNMEELENYLDHQQSSSEQEFEKYSRYLYKLEKNHSVTESEREAYIGIYRLFRQLEKTDGAAIGALMNQNAELTVKNLLSAMRSNKKRGMEVTVDDNFAGISGSYTGKSISQQIESGIGTAYYKKLASDIMDQLDGGKMHAVPADGDVSLEQLAQILHEEQTDEEAEHSYVKQQAEIFRQAAVTDETVVKELLDYHQPVRADYVLAAGLLAKERGKAAGRLYELAEKAGGREALDEAMEQLHDGFTDADGAREAYARLEQVYTNILEEAVYGPDADGMIDIREISNLYKQVSFSAGMAREENYEVPVKIGDEVTSINLKIIHGSDESGRVTASMETAAYGRVAAQFSLSVKGAEYQLSGYVACSRSDALEALEQSEAGLRNLLERADIKVVGLNFIYNSELDLSALSHTSAKEEAVGDNGDSTQEVSTKKLYETAKLFIEYIKER